MHKFFSFNLALLMTLLSMGQNKLDESQLKFEIEQSKTFQKELNEHYADAEKSPLLKEDREHFESLSFFDVNSDMILKATFEQILNGDTFEMKTSTERLPLYRYFGKIHFTYMDSSYTLEAYQNIAYSQSEKYDSTLFVPFTDHTNGIESYGGGRYIDFEIPNTEKVVLNFNLAYNPYCAYNDRYSCPIPPEANKLPFEVKAGVLKYHD